MRASFRLLRTQAFRIVLVYVLLFAVSVSALLFFTYWNTRRTLDAQTDQIIEAEITGLTEQYQRLGLRGPGGKRDEPLAACRARRFISSPTARIASLAGNLDSWPPITADRRQFRRIRL